MKRVQLTVFDLSMNQRSKQIHDTDPPPLLLQFLVPGFLLLFYWLILEIQEPAGQKEPACSSRPSNQGGTSDSSPDVQLPLPETPTLFFNTSPWFLSPGAVGPHEGSSVPSAPACGYKNGFISAEKKQRSVKTSSF